uniref:LIM/homeobox protein Lhx2 n=1 Tax=Cacopsylla melanoneura TaxID=428564 RepID=A0A8D8YA41_9HEMI
MVKTMALADMLHSGDLSSSMESLSYESGAGNSSPGSGISHQRTKRMRTSFKHHQLRTMKSYFNINQNPDAKDLKQLAQKTGLSKRVLQVWFQNARAKWRRNVMRSDNGLGQLSVQSVLGGPPSVGPNSMLIGSEDELSLHHPQQTPPHSQMGGYGDMYN